MTVVMACEPLFGCVWLAAFAFHARCLCVVLVVGLGVDRIVDACAYCDHPPLLLFLPPGFTGGLWHVCGGGCCLCWPISTSQLRPLPVFHFWPINPVVCWGPTKTPRCLAETLS